MSLYRSEEMGSIVQLTYGIPTRLQIYNSEIIQTVGIILHTRLYRT